MNKTYAQQTNVFSARKNDTFVRYVGLVRNCGYCLWESKMAPNHSISDFMKKTKVRGPKPFAKILRDLMTEQKLTVREAAKLAGVSPSTLADWRGGALPADYLAVKKLANGLDVSLSFLLTGEEDNRSNHSQPNITEVFEDGGELFDGFAKITIQRLVPRKKAGS